jgi:hypothetical protein
MDAFAELTDKADRSRMFMPPLKRVKPLTGANREQAVATTARAGE